MRFPNCISRHTRYFEPLGEQMPPGMKAVGGVGFGLFECVQDLVGYTGLCYMSVDDPGFMKTCSGQ